ncbi:MAG: hypothetical protein QKV09_gp1 [Fushun ischnura senegalensis lispivirus 1]|uniref:Uncharacterized protein n=1 Tax=Fushun ischnura senegalensis lispivirus 1 TaxID=2905564 RepID=A0A8K1XFK2_9MONO|nr:MAG: hypothetical protein QKV09_gp1 [Fushun ischnura senegalensis lispivirus 1]UHM27651.1 MAG: hypothetical protein FISLV1_gp1 [Fushun ischnura senegalensis lispivirus 1]
MMEHPPMLGNLQGIYNIAPQLNAGRGHGARPPLISSINASKNLPFRHIEDPEEAQYVPNADEVLTAKMPMETLHILEALRDDQEDYTYDFDRANSWLYYAAVNSENNSVSDNLSIFFSTLALYLPSIRNVLEKHAADFTFHPVLRVDLDGLLGQLGVDDGEAALPDNDYISNNNSNKGVVNFGTQCLLIGKSLSTNNHSPWMKKRYQSVGNSLGVRSDLYETMNDLPLKYCKDIHAILCANKLLRSEVFNLLLYCSKQNTPLRQMMVGICNLLAGCELTGFLLIYRHLLIENPMVFYLQEVMSLTPDLQIALRVFESYGENRLYLKLLCGNKHSTTFNTKALLTLAKIAKCIAEESGEESIKNYQVGPISTGEKNLCERVIMLKRYMRASVTQESQIIKNQYLAENEGNKALLTTLYAKNFSNLDDAISSTTNYIPTFSEPGQPQGAQGGAN